MEAKVAVKELVESEEKPPHTYDHNIEEASHKNDIVSFSIFSFFFLYKHRHTQKHFIYTLLTFFNFCAVGIY